MSFNMQISNMMGVRPADAGMPGQVAGPQVAAFGSYTTGQTITGEVVSVADNTANIQLPNGKEVQMQFPQEVPARPGDSVDLTLMSKSQNSVQLKMEAINGQSVRLEASNMEAYLMDRGIPPTRLNEAAAQVFIRNQITPTPRNVSNLIDVAASLPEVPTSLALVMAENNVPPTQENADILAKWANEPATLGSDVAALETMVARDSGVSAFATALESGVQQAGSPQLAASIMNAPGFEQLAQQLAGMTGQDAAPAQQAIQSFVATLDLPPQEQQAAQTILTDAFAATAEQFGEPVQLQTQTAAPQAARTAMPQLATGDGAANQVTAAAQTEQGASQTQAAQEQTAPQAPADSASAQSTQSTGRRDVSQLQAAIEQKTAEAQPKQEARQSVAVPAAEQEAQASASKSENSWNGPRRITVPTGEAQTAERPPEQAAARSGDEASVRNEASQILSNLQKFVVRTKGGREAVQEDGAALQQGVRHQRELANLTKASVSRLFGQDAPAAQRANQLSSEVRLGSQMDQFFYAQIPYQTAEQKGTADLYVFQRKPQKAEAERTHITVLIGLDTQHMGRVESVLRSADGQLSVEFRVATARVQRFMEDSMKTFSEEMKESGFPLESVRVTQIREKVTPVNAMKIMEPAAKQIKLRGLDIEA